MDLSALGYRVLRWPVVRLVLALFAFVVAILARDILMGMVAGGLSLGANAPQLWLAPPRSPASVTAVGALYSVLAFVTMVTVGFGAYVVYCRTVEKRTPSELGTRGAGAELAAGVVIGLGLVFSVVGVLAVLGHVQIHRTNAWLMIVPGLAVAATAASMEELAVRGVLFRIVEESLGTWGALMLTAALFGLLHAGNQNASWISGLTIAASGGLVLGAAYVLTRRLWLAIGLHFGVNAAQGALLGLAVSGRDTPGLLATRLSGPAALTGGPFGVEASGLVLVLAVLLTGAMLQRAVRLQRIVPLRWKRSATILPAV